MARKYMFAYKDGVRISNFTDYIQTPARRGDKVDPSGNGTCWVFPIEGFELKPGSLYEFGFLRGMQANNGITLVLAKNDKGDYTGYIQQTSSRSDSRGKGPLQQRERQGVSSLFPAGRKKTTMAVLL